MHCIWPQSEKGQTTSKMPYQRQLFITPRSLAHGADKTDLKLQNIRCQNSSSASVSACYDALNKVITFPGPNFITLGVLKNHVVFFLFFSDCLRWFWCTARNTHLGLIIFQALLLAPYIYNHLILTTAFYRRCYQYLHSTGAQRSWDLPRVVKLTRARPGSWAPEPDHVVLSQASFLNKSERAAPRGLVRWWNRQNVKQGGQIIFGHTHTCHPHCSIPCLKSFLEKKIYLYLLSWKRHLLSTPSSSARHPIRVISNYRVVDMYESGGITQDTCKKNEHTQVMSSQVENTGRWAMLLIKKILCGRDLYVT